MAKKKEEKTNVMRLLDQKNIAYTAHTYPEDGWTIDKIVEAWNWRTRNEGSNCL